MCFSRDIEHPEITRLLKEGMPEEKPICCPVCGEELDDYVFVDNFGDVIGCEKCVHVREVYEVFGDETE